MKPKLKRVLNECISELKCSTQNKKISKKDLHALSMEISGELNNCFLEGSNNQTNFNDILAKSNQLVPKMSRNEKRNNERKIIKKE